MTHGTDIRYLGTNTDKTGIILAKHKPYNLPKVTQTAFSVETCDRKKLNNAGKICKIKLSDKGTSSSGEGAMFGDSLPPQMLLANNGNFFCMGLTAKNVRSVMALTLSVAEIGGE